MSDQKKRFEFDLSKIPNKSEVRFENIDEIEPVYFYKGYEYEEKDLSECPLCEQGHPVKRRYDWVDESGSIGPRIEATKKECCECGRTFVGTLMTCSNHCTKIWIDKAIASYNKVRLKAEVDKIEREKEVRRKKFLQHRPLGGLT